MSRNDEKEKKSDLDCEINVNRVISKKNKKGIEGDIIELERYYCVFYDTYSNLHWYVGRVIGKCEEKYKIKFLKEELNYLVWPKTDDIQMLEKKFIFYGPLQLQGMGPFHLRREDIVHIKNTFKKIKETN